MEPTTLPASAWMLMASMLTAASVVFYRVAKLAYQGEVRASRFSEVEGYDDDA
jgi:hypothetical protein